jgi:tetrahydromethanopterin S-methyltransferase subunit G
MAQLEERMAKIEGIVGQMNERLNHLESELSSLRSELLQEIRGNFRWTLGLLITMWVTLILAFLFG